MKITKESPGIDKAVCLILTALLMLTTIFALGLINIHTEQPLMLGNLEFDTFWGRIHLWFIYGAILFQGHLLRRLTAIL